MNTNDLPLLKPINDLIFVANDGSDFASFYIGNCKDILNSFNSVNSDENTKIFPENYQEDFIQLYKRKKFKLSEWIIAGVFISDSDEVNKCLLVNKSNKREGFVFDFETNFIELVFYRGFKIQESIESNIIDDDAFLESINFKEEVKFDYYISYDEDPNFENENEIELSLFEIPLPVFEATSKKKIINFGNTNAILQDDENDDDQDLTIEVECPKFEGRKKSKVPNLGFSGKQKINKKIDNQEVKNIEIAKPAFEANSSKKVANLGYSSQSKKSNYINKPIIVEPTNIQIELPKFEAQDKKKIIDYDSVIEKEKRRWSVIDIYKVKPNVYNGERSILNCSDFDKEKYLIDNAYKELKGIYKFNISNECVFAPTAISEDDSLFNVTKSFDINNFKILFIVVSKDNIIEEVILRNSDNCLVLTKTDNLYCLKALTKNGVSLDDRALPYFNFDQLLNYLGIDND